MRRRTYSILRIGATLLLAGCSQNSAVFTEAEALEKESKFEEATAKFELVCALDPQSQPCAGVDAKITAVREKAADKAIAEGHYRKADLLLRRALVTADEAQSKILVDRLAAEELKAGISFELAAEEPDKLRAWDTMDTLAGSKAPVAEKAKEWTARERPGVLVARIHVACSPKPKFSCSATWAELEALPQKPSGLEEARSAYEAEQKRIAKPLLIARRFLTTFAERGRKQKALEKCVETEQAKGLPTSDGYYGYVRSCSSDLWDDTPYARWDQEHSDDETFRKSLASIADPVLVAELDKRRTQALKEGNFDKFEPKTPAGGGR